MSKNHHKHNDPIIAGIEYNKALTEDINKCSMWCEFVVPPVFRIRGSYMMSETEKMLYATHNLDCSKSINKSSNVINYGKF